MKVAIVAVHGVIPQAQYGFQDQVATALAQALNEAPKGAPGHGMWQTSVVFPTVLPDNCDPHAPRTAAIEHDPLLAQKPQIARIYRAGDDPESPQSDSIDVHEAYWSPIDKGRTTAASVVAWLVRTIFLPFNDVARYMAAPGKVAWDVGFVVCALGIGVALMAGAVVSFAWSLNAFQNLLSAPPAGAWPIPTDFSKIDYGAALAYVTNPQNLVRSNTYVLLAGAVGAYLLAQFGHALSSIVMNRKELQRDPVQLFSRAIALALLLGLAAALLGICWYFAGREAHRAVGGWIALVLVTAFAAAKAGQSLSLWFIANFFGDVQIYTTRDNNSAFFVLREAILGVVTRTILDVIQTPPDLPDYDRVYVFAHSLGSTISLDALMRIFNMRREGLVRVEQYEKIRAFVTFGTALEKTKYFFDVWSPTLSQQYDEWRNDLYGALFTADKRVLNGRKQRGIFWLNSWYFSDFVADKIESYRSVVLPNENPSTATGIRKKLHRSNPGESFVGRLVACNREGRGRFNLLTGHAVTHGDYLSDPWFWHGPDDAPECCGALAVVTADFAQRQIVPTVKEDVHDVHVADRRERVETVAKKDLYRYKTRDIIRS